MLIIYAHPNKKGHCGYALSVLEKVLKDHNKSYEVLDLYAEDYGPVMLDKEHYSSGGNLLSPETKRLQLLLKKYDRFFVIYPTWWNSVPAILKGFFDKVLTPPFAFKYVGPRPIGMLKGKKAFVITTTGAPSFYNFLISRNRGLKTVLKDTLRFCGIKTKGCVISGATRLHGPQKQKITQSIIRSLDFLFSKSFGKNNVKA